ncbi:hypothetical protein [Burkholderia stagnalis]|uniref:hypothetical protein n=1 Tax=Burkholderia stagnalis TaxID=1503054 RepID=UPI000F5B95D9|nr:hypothetical protein [Burkholderia stagnalis]RQQ00421.1 hypothetical protein DF164_29740 [Burkholderia stagnalis]RQS90865.1 hypothetical protein DF035_34245 [Burkholderia contaminans]RQY63618.1 hypothetical protein DF110_33545 [Burkholderia stagnalis]
MTETGLKPGTKVRERGKRQVMIVKGHVGLAVAASPIGRRTVNVAHKVVCEWRTQKGALRSRGFLVSELEVVQSDQ